MAVDMDRWPATSTRWGADNRRRRVHPVPARRRDPIQPRLWGAPV